MTAPRDDGGPAFPQINTEVWQQGLSGMSLRDYFAAKAMQAYVTQASPASDEDGDFVAKYAYGIADAMLAERERQPDADERAVR